MAIGTEVERLIVRLMGDGKNYEDMLRRAENRTRTYTDKAGRMHDKLTGKFVSGQAVMAASLRRTGLAMKRAGASMRSLGRSAITRVTLPLTIMAGASVKAFSNFDKAMVESTSIMKLTGDQAERMRQQAIGLSMSGQALQGPKDLAKSYFFLASAGKDAEQSMNLLPVVSKFATAGAFDMALATDLLTDAQSALGLSSKKVAEDTTNLARVADVLVKANTLANASVQQFSTAITSKAGAALKAFNKDIEEGVALLAALADQGIKAELAGNALGRMIRLLSKSSLDNAKAHEVLGFKVFDTAGKMRNLGDIVANLEQVLAGMTDENKVATLAALGFEARVQAVILPLLGTSKAIKKYEEQLRKAKGITDEVANKQMKAFANQMTVLKNQVTVMAIEIGKSLAPMLTTLASAIKFVVVAWRSWSAELKSAITTVALLAAAMGPLLIVLGFVVSSVGHLTVIYATLRTTTIGLTVATIGLKAAMLGVIGLGFAAFIVAVRVDLARLTNEANDAADAFERMSGKRLQGLRGDALTAEGVARRGDVGRAQEALRKAQKEKEQDIRRGLKTILQIRRKAFGFDPVGAAEKGLERAEVRLRKFTEFQAQARKAAKDTARTAQVAESEARSKENLLAEAARQAEIDDKRKQAREKAIAQTEQVIKSLQMEIFEMRNGADAAQLWAAAQNGASESSQRYIEGLQKERKELDKVAKAAEKAARKQEEFMRRGQRVIDQFQTPLQKFIARRKELTDLLRGGGLGQGAEARGTFARAMEDALKELGQGEKARLGLGGVVRQQAALPGNVAAQVGSLESRKRFLADQQRIAGVPAAEDRGQRIEGFLERIADAVEAETGIKVEAGGLEA